MQWNRIQEYPEECIIVFKMLQYQTIKWHKFQSYWDYWLHTQTIQVYLRHGVYLPMTEDYNVYIK